MNQAPTEEKPNVYIKKIKTAQLIYIIEKVGLMNQAPTEEKPNAYIRNIENGAWPHFSAIFLLQDNREGYLVYLFADLFFRF